MDLISSFCKTLYNCTYLPIHYYKNNRPELVLPDTGFPFDLAERHLKELLSVEQPVSYLVTKEFHYFGLIQNKQTQQFVVIGPVISILPSPASVRNVMKEYGIPLAYKEQLTELYQFTPTYTFHQFCHFLSLFYQELFHATIDIEACLNLYTDTGSPAVAFIKTYRI